MAFHTKFVTFGTKLFVMAKQVKKAAKKTAKKSAKRPVSKPSKKVAKKTAKNSAKKSAPIRTLRPAPAQKGKRFLIIYHAPIEAMEQTANVTPEQQAEGMAMWNAWAKRAGSRLHDLGAPLINGKRLRANGSTSPSTKDVAGYSLLQAEDWDEVMDLLEGHPHISGWHPEATIEIHETILLPGM
jgi:hypothetical protein